MLFERNGGGWSQLGGAFNSGALAAGTSLRLVATGSNISFQQNGVTRISVTDTSITGGAPGMIAFGNSTADNWSGGSGSGGSTASYTVGGTVSGLSGTLVLQDNGGDDLSVSANGPFTFETSLRARHALQRDREVGSGRPECSMSNGSGAVDTANVSNVAVSSRTSPRRRVLTISTGRTAA